jgi:hypothetical protein
MKNKYLIALLLMLMAGVSSLRAQYTADVKTFNRPALNEQQVSMDIAYNGWLYQAFSTDSGYVLVMSKDNGNTWVMLDSVERPGVQYTVKMVVAGTDSNYIRVCLAINAFTPSTGLTALVVQYYDGATGVYTGNAIVDSYNELTRALI